MTDLTAADLDAMSVGEIVVDSDGDEWTKAGQRAWRLGEDSPWAQSLFVSNYGPLRRRESPVEQPTALQVRKERRLLRLALDDLLGKMAAEGPAEHYGELNWIIGHYFPEEA